MGLAPESRKRMVEAQLVEKRTFLHLEPDEDTLDECSLPQPCLVRSVTDSLVHYGADADFEANCTTTSGCKSSLRSSESNPQDEGWPSSETVDTDDDEDGGGEDVTQQGNVPHAFQGVSSHAKQEQLFYYFPLPGSPLWGLGAGMSEGKTLASGTATCNLPPFGNMETLARAAQLHSAAVELEAAAEQYRVVAQRALLALSMKSCGDVSPGRQPEEKVCPGKQFSQVLREKEFTTLMLRNIPNDYTRTMILELLDSKALSGKYDFVYLPIDFNRMAALGYVFVNFVSQADAELARLCLQGFQQWNVQSKKVCEVGWGNPLQGLTAHIERYRSSPVMHKDVPDEFKPIIFRAGIRVPFPPPTKRVRPPRSKGGEAVEVVE